MAKASGKVIWHGDEVVIKLNALNLDEIDKLALAIIVESDPPVDTGFLDASAYVNSATGLNTFAETWQPGKFISRHSGAMVPRQQVTAPEPHPKNGAVAGWAAIYAFHVEQRTDFIFKAVHRVAAANQ